MTNTKFRKRALLSSVAMLLVALVALGSATFAWFVANPTVTATGLQMQTVAAPGLKVASWSDYVKGGKVSYTFASTANLADQDFSLTPASPNLKATLADLSLPFATIKAAADSNYARNTDLKFTGLTPMKVDSYASNEFGLATNTGDVYYEDLYFQKSGEGANVSIARVAVQIASASTAIAPGVKVALVAQVPGQTASYSLLGVWKANSGTDTSYWAGSTDNSNLNAAADAYTYTANEGNVTLSTPISVGSEAAGQGAVIRVYVYLDGEESVVKSTNATSLSQLVTGITVKVSTDAATAITFS